MMLTTGTVQKHRCWKSHILIPKTILLLLHQPSLPLQGSCLRTVALEQKVDVLPPSCMKEWNRKNRLECSCRLDFFQSRLPLKITRFVLIVRNRCARIARAYYSIKQSGRSYFVSTSETRSHRLAYAHLFPH